MGWLIINVYKSLILWYCSVGPNIVALSRMFSEVHCVIIDTKS